MTRRTFASTLPAAAASLAADGGLTVGLIETAEGDHLPYYRRLASRAGVGRFVSTDVTGAAQMMREAKPVLVAVSTEPERAPEAARIALEGGAHVIVEKPGCTQFDQFVQMAKTADAHNRRLMLAMATRLDPAAVKARELLRAGWMGRVYGASMVWVADQTRLHNPAYQKTWKTSKKRGGGGKLIFHGIHYLDLLQDLAAQEITRVTAICRNVGGAPSEVEDAAVVSMELKNGALCTLNTGYYLDKGYDNEIRIWGSLGWLRFNPRAEPSLAWYSTHSAAPRGEQAFHSPSPRESVYDLMFQAAVDAVAGKREWYMTTAESVSVLRAVFAAYRSAESGQNVAVS